MIYISLNFKFSIEIHLLIIFIEKSPFSVKIEFKKNMSSQQENDIKRGPK